jgi:hypothetical protein
MEEKVNYLTTTNTTLTDELKSATFKMEDALRNLAFNREQLAEIQAQVHRKDAEHLQTST